MPETDKSLVVDKVRELQRKLYVCAKKSKTRRFHALYDRIYRSDVLWKAWIRVRSNKGAAGVDEITLRSIEEQGVAQFLEGIQADLEAGRYRPLAVRRQYIDKGDGKQRPLGIPTVRDRVAQMATKIIVEPIFGAACKGIDQAGGSPVAVVVRFGCVAMHGVDERRLWSAKARANVLRAARSHSTGGLAKLRAVGDEHQIGVERLTRVNRVAGCWASRAPRRWAKANGTNEETDRSSWCEPRRVGDGTRRMVGDPKQGRSRARKATRKSRRDEAWGEHETDGSGRSSVDAEGQHNPGGAKDPWGSGVLCRGEDRPDCLWPIGINDRVAERALRGRQTRRRGRAFPKRDPFRCLGAVLGKTRRTES